MSIYEGKEPYLFISYSHTDNDVIGEITQMLDENGCRYWYDMGLHSGNDWNEVVASKLRDSAACLLLLSPTAASSKYVKNELTLVENMEIPLHPVLIKDYVGASIRDLPTDIAMTIARIQMVSMECNYRKKILRGLPSSVFAQINEDDFKIRALYNLEKYNGNGGDVIVPDGVTSIGDSAFCFCRSLASITIPDSVTQIGEDAFYWCSELTCITIPDSVIHIGEGAFVSCTSLVNITIPNRVTGIRRYAFDGCSGLTSITIPDSVTSIDDSAFNNCQNLTSITFQGTKAQWNAIIKGCDWNADTGNYTVYCTDGSISK